MRIRKSRRLGALSALFAVVLLAGCGGGSGSGGGGNAPSSITVLAASSLTGAFTDLGQQFESENPGVTVKFAFDSSATLAQQAVGGAPADVLATADQKTMDSAHQVQLDEPTVFATNVMVLVTPANNPAGISSFTDLDKTSVKYVVCVPTAPCGSVGAALLAQNHITSNPVSTEVDVKSVLAKVTSGEADAGLVYKTDAIAAGEQVRTFPIPGTASQVTTYPIVTLTQSKSTSLSQEFIDLVTGPSGQRVLHQAGFGPP
jgi:molybdate transport system substrate-binding protein